MELGTELNETCQQINDNFFVVPWNPKHYNKGLHVLTVTVVDKMDRENRVTHPFQLDEQQSLEYDLAARFILKSDAIVIFQIIFWIAWAICVVPLIFLRIWHELIKGILHFPLL